MDAFSASKPDVRSYYDFVLDLEESANSKVVTKMR